MNAVDVLRVIAVACLFFDILFLPRALDVHHRAERISLMILGIDIIFISCAGRIIAHLGEPIVLYGLPLIGPGSFILALYIVQALWAQHQGRYTNER